jgi:hypothetical protein
LTERRGAGYGFLAGSILWLLARGRIAFANSAITLTFAPPLSIYSDIIAAILGSMAFLLWIGSLIRRKALLGTTRNGFIYGIGSSYTIIQIVFLYLVHSTIIS